MVSCMLCLKKATKHIKLCSKEGQELRCSDVIAKHFWLKPNNLKESKESVCLVCWSAVRDFHDFYQTVAEAHNYLEYKDVEFNTSDQLSMTDPLPSVLKSEEDNPTNQLLNDQLFDPEVKLEVHDLEFLPEIEVIEANIQPVNERERDGPATRGKRKCAEEKIDPKTTNKRIKHERSKISDDDDSETELPLSMLLQSNEKAEPHTDSLNGLEETTVGKAAKLSETNAPKKRRGRPRKVQIEKTVDDENEAVSQKPSTATNVEIEVKIENSPEHDNDFGSFEHNSGTDDSASSSSDTGDSESESLPDWMEPRERYAEIPKRVVVKPKKYRKRPKPLVPPKRMTKDELEKKRLQQEEYDNIIAKFFEKFQCPKCSLLVQNFGEMRRHFSVSHNDNSGYMECCGRKFQMRRLLAEHILLHSNPELFKCSICTKILQDSRTLEQHEAAHNQPPVETKEKKTFQCDKCTKKFTTKATLEHHFFSKHVPKSEFKFPCTMCNKKLPTERTLKEHMKYAHDPESAIICEKCGKKMRSQYTLKKHVQLEHSDAPRPAPVPVQCEICGTWLRHISGLKQHMKSIHEDSTGEHRCHICNKTSTNARALRRHVYLNHEAERKFKCTMCEKAFKRPQDLREHTSVHTGEVLYTCPNCPMTFFSNANMYKHRQRLHKAEYEAGRKKGPQPPNILRQAKDATAEFKMRQEHTSVHTGEVLYTCPNCPMTFFSSANMYKHRQRLHKAEYEASKKKVPQPPNIVRQAKNATAEMKMQQASEFFSQKLGDLPFK